MKRLLGYVALGCVFLLMACEHETTCHQDMTTTMVVTLHADSMDVEGNVHTYAAWDSLYVLGVGAETVLYSSGSIAQIGLTLRPDTTETAYLMRYHNQIDTLIIAHTPRLQYVSLACGCAVYHTITGARSTDLRVDSVSIINSSIETVAQENLRIYMHE